MLENELALRIFFFVGILAAVAIWEALSPKRVRLISRGIRWTHNLSLVILSSLSMRLVIPFTAVGAAAFSSEQQFGLLHYLDVPFVMAVVMSLLMLDFLIYLQHVIFHHVPIFWRLHKIHHIDQEIDVTTGVRFHPVEMILSALIKCAAVLLLGVPILAVVIFEILLNATAMFNHGNINLPKSVDRLLRLFIVTPDMHRVHHSVIPSETNSNFGFNLPWWDRIFGTYRAQPSLGHEKMDIGVKDYPSVYETGLMPLLVIPFMKDKKQR